MKYQGSILRVIVESHSGGLDFNKIALAIGLFLFPLHAYSQSNQTATYYNDGNKYFEAGQYQAAADAYKRAYDTERSSAQPREKWLLSTAGYQGVALYYADNYQAAIEPLRNAIQLCSKLNDVAHFAYFNYVLGQTYYQVGNYQSALYFSNGAYQAYAQLNDHSNDYDLCLTVGYSYYGLSYYNGALNWLRTAQRLAEENKNQQAVNQIKSVVATCREKMKNYTSKPVQYEAGKFKMSFTDKVFRYDDRIVKDSFIMSPDGRHFAYQITDKIHNAVLQDGEGDITDHLFMQIYAEPQYSKNSATVAYVGFGALGGGKIIVNGRVVDESSGLGGYAISPDGGRVAYIITRTGGKSWCVAEDMKDGKAYDGVEYPPVYSPDSKRLAYAVWRNKKSFLVVDNVEQPNQFDSMATFMTVFSPDSRRIAYVGARGGKYVVVVDGNEWKPYTGVNYLAFTPDSKQLVAIVLKDADNRMLVIDNVESPKSYRRRVPPVISNDSKRIVFAGMLPDERWVLIENGKEVRNHTFVSEGNIKFSVDSKRLAYFAQKDQDWIVVIDGKESPLYQGLINNSFSFSPDGQRYAYAAYRKDKFVVVIDGNESQEYENFGAGVPAFSPDSRHVVWAAQPPNESFKIFLDGVSICEFDSDLDLFRPMFDANDALHSLIYDLKGVRLIEFKILNP